MGFDTIYLIPRDEPWKRYLRQLSPEDLAKALEAAQSVNDNATIEYVESLLLCGDSKNRK